MAIWEVENKDLQKKKATLALLIPHQSIVSMEWAFAFRNLRLPPHIYFFNRGMPIDVAREQMTRDALKHDIEYLFFLDSDVILEPDAVMQLIQLSKQFNLPILSALYWARKHDALGTPACWKIIERKGNDIKLAPVAVEEYIRNNQIIEVDAIGMGAALIRRDVFDKLNEKNPDKPFFEWGLGRKNLPQISEDFMFCLRCIDELGIHPYVATSVRAHHICTARRNRDNGILELVEI
mgnify:CR=1 FL=1